MRPWALVRPAVWQPSQWIGLRLFKIGMISLNPSLTIDGCTCGANERIAKALQGNVNPCNNNVNLSAHYRYSDDLTYCGPFIQRRPKYWVIHDNGAPSIASQRARATAGCMYPAR